MKRRLHILMPFLGLLTCSLFAQGEEGTGIRCTEADMHLVEDLLSTGSPGSLLDQAHAFLGTPYVAHSLEGKAGEAEQLVVHLQGMDCTTFVEYSLALHRCARERRTEFGDFAEELKRIRYRDGHLEGYASRLHYFCDWIHNNQDKGVVKDLSASLGGVLLDKEINFMSSHPEAYVHLRNNQALVEVMQQQEEAINKRRLYYLPVSRIAGVQDAFKDGDIVAVCTSIGGLAVMHTGFIQWQGQEVRLLHASSSAGKVLLSEQKLSTYLESTPRATGIMLIRPL